MADSKVWLDVPYAEKDDAKAKGARWDSAARRWYAPRPGMTALDRWQAVPDPGGLTVTPSSGTITLAPTRSGTGDPAGCRPTPPATQSLEVTAPTNGSYALRVNLSTTNGVTLPPVVVDVEGQR